MEITLFTDMMIRLVLGFGIGFTIGMIGIGGGILVVPSLIYIVGLPTVSAVGTGLVYSVLAKSYGTYQHFRLRTIRKRTALYIVLGGAPAVIVTSFTITYLAKTAGSDLDIALKIVISITMLITWALMLMSLLRGPENYYVPPKNFSSRRKFYGIVTGAGVGGLIGATSVGGGVLIIPILITIFQLSPSNAVGTSVLVGITMSALGSFAYLLGGNVEIFIAAVMFIGSVPGVYLGSRTAVKMPPKTLSIILFAIVTIGMIVMFAGIKG